METVNEHQKQALDFLNATSTSLTIKFKKYGPHFEGDKQSRNIYRCRLKNELGSYNFNFGQSIDGTQKGEAPSAYDILTCLTKYDPVSFEDFCSDFGYDSDSRSAEKIYKAVAKEWKAIDKLFTSEQIELLQEIQ